MVLNVKAFVLLMMTINYYIVQGKSLILGNIAV